MKSLNRGNKEEKREWSRGITIMISIAENEVRARSNVQLNDHNLEVGIFMCQQLINDFF